MAHQRTLDINFKRDFLIIKTDEKDGLWVYGYSLWHTPLKGCYNDPGAGCAASGIDHRYNKKFPSRPEAILACLLYCREYFKKPDILRLIDAQINLYRTQQLPLF